MLQTMKGDQLGDEAAAADQAGNHGEAIAKYVQAAEELLKAVDSEDDPAAKQVLRGRCTEYMARAESLKHGLPPTSQAPAVTGGGVAAEPAAPAGTRGAVAWLRTSWANIKPKVVRLCNDLRSRGAFSHAAEFNATLLNPIQRARAISVKSFVAELRQTITLNPPHPEAGFLLWNSLAFWFAIAETIAWLLFGGNAVQGVAGVTVSYCIAYFLYWIFVHSQEKWYTRRALLFTASLTIYYIFSAIGGLIMIVPAVLNGCKAAATAIICVYAWKLDALLEQPDIITQAGQYAPALLL